MSVNKVDLVHESVTRSIIGAFYYVFNYLGFGFLESVYAAALTKVLRARGHLVEREVLVEVWFEDEIIARQRLDMLVDKKVVVELKAADRLPLAARVKLGNYLSATGFEVGLVLFFGPSPMFLREYRRNVRSHPTESAVSD
jgi:GxxExxY protein